MGSKTVTRADLSEAVYQDIGLSRAEASKLVEDVLERISQSLVDGDKVKVSSFGTFNIREKRGRMGRNPKTGKEAEINARRVLVFRPSHVLKDRISQNISHSDD